MNPTIYPPDAVSTPVISVAPIVVPTIGREVELQIRVSAPTTGTDLPVLLLSHGHGRSTHLSSLNGYAPLANFYAAHGFVVIQPTHLDSATLTLSGNDPDAPLYWRTRTKDMSDILDHLTLIENAIPGLAGRINHNTIAVVGHSLGGLTASMLLGAQVTDPLTGTRSDQRDERITAGVLLAAPGRGGDALTETIPPFFTFLSSIDFQPMLTAALVVAGDNDPSPHLTVAGSSWHADPYRLAPAPKALLTLTGGEHQLGGVSGYDVTETTDEDPERLAAVQWLTWAYLRTQLGIDPTAWTNARTALAQTSEALGTIETK